MQRVASNSTYPFETDSPRGPIRFAHRPKSFHLVRSEKPNSSEQVRPMQRPIWMSGPTSRIATAEVKWTGSSWVRCSDGVVREPTRDCPHAGLPPDLPRHFSPPCGTNVYLCTYLASGWANWGKRRERTTSDSSSRASTLFRTSWRTR